MRLIGLCAMCLAVSACGSGSESAPDGKAGAQSPGVAVSATPQKRPGRWETKFAIEAIDDPELPKEMRDGITDPKAAVTQFICVKPEDVTQPGAEWFFPGSSGCELQSYNFAGGKIDAIGTCRRPEGSMEAAITGAIDPENLSVRIIGKSRQSDGAVTTMTMTMNSRRVGECNGTEK